MERQYFDNTLLAQFYVTKMPLSVFVEGDLLKIVDADDITDPFMGSGMKISGEMEPFDYRNIEFMMIGKNKFTIEDVNKAFAAKDNPTAAKEEKPKEEEEPAEEEAPNESIKGRRMKRLTEKLGLAQVSEPYSIQTGDMVHNVNPTCSHFGSKGIAMGASMEDGIPVIKYAVTNVGATFKPGDMLTKTADQLALMDLSDDDFDYDDELSDIGGEEEEWEIMGDEEEFDSDEEFDDEFEDDDDDDDDDFMPA
jgi:hypothetical protein